MSHLGPNPCLKRIDIASSQKNLALASPLSEGLSSSSICASTSSKPGACEMTASEETENENRHFGENPSYDTNSINPSEILETCAIISKVTVSIEGSENLTRTVLPSLLHFAIRSSDLSASESMFVHLVRTMGFEQAFALELAPVLRLSRILACAATALSQPTAIDPVE